MSFSEPLRAYTSRTLKLAAAVVLLASASACGFTVATGSGDIVDEAVDVGAFDRLAVSHAFDVEVAVGGDPSVTIHVDDNLRDLVLVRESGGLLSIGLRPGVTVRRATLEATVNAPQLDEIRASGASGVRVADPLSGRLDVRVSGASEVIAETSVDRLRVRASGASTVRLAGQARQADLEASGASNLELGGLEAATATVRLSGATDGEIHVDDRLEAVLSGASTLTYSGEPDVIRESTSGAATLRRR